MMAFVDHGIGGTGEPLAAMLRTGRATANSAADQIAVLDDALAQLPTDVRSRVLVRGDSGAGVREFVGHVHNLGLQYSVGVYGRHRFWTRWRRCRARRGRRPWTQAASDAKVLWSLS